MTETKKKNQRLLWIVVSPVIWAAHFALSYMTVSIWCAKFAGPDQSLWKVRIAISVYTALSLAGICIIGWIGYRRHAYGNAGRPHDGDTPEDRNHFIGFSTLVLSALSAVAVVYAALVVFFFESCH